MKTLTRKNINRSKRTRFKCGISITPKGTAWSVHSYGEYAKSRIRVDMLFGFSRYFFRKQRQYTYVLHIGRIEMFFYFLKRRRKQPMQNYLIFLTILSSILMLLCFFLCISIANLKSDITCYREIIDEYKTFINGLKK